MIFSKFNKEVKKDMESDYPMDRLICGDVGFGKTEVALRAIVRVVSFGKNVLFLCQHCRKRLFFR